MNSTWRSLVWKEWREHRWILALLGALLVAIAAIYGMLRPQSVLSVLTTALVLVVPLAAAFIAAGIAAREQSVRTMAFLQLLPISMARPAGAKLLVAAFTMVTPIVAAVAVAAACIWTRGYGLSELETFDRMFWPVPWGIANRFVALTVAPALVGISLMLWMAAASVNRSDEVRAGAVGFLAVAVCWCLLIWLSEGRDFGREPWFALLAVAAPGGPGAVAGEIDMALASLVVLVSHGMLVGWYVNRFGRIAAGSRQTVEARSTVTVPTWLAPPRRRPWSAILWKQTRESAPLALMAATAIMAAYLVVAWMHYEQMNRIVLEDLMIFCLVIWLLSGLLVAVVSGIGVFMDDLQPRLHAFWRSRPINVDQLFWLKFSGGLVVTIGTLTLALAPLAVIIFGIHAANAELPAVFREAQELIGVGMVVQIGAFCAGVAAMTVLRQAVLAATTALAAMVGVTVLLSTAEPALRPAAAAWICTPLIVMVVIVPWLAMRYDWGWKR